MKQRQKSSHAKIPPLVFLPGLLCNADLWRDQIDFLSAHFSTDTLNVVDFRHDDSISQMACRVIASMPRPFICFALSMGGYVAFEIFRQFPEAVLGLGLLNTSARLDSPQRKSQRQALFDFIKKTETIPRERNASTKKILVKKKFTGISDHLLPGLIHKNHLTNKNLTERIKAMALDIGREGFLNEQKAILSRASSLETLKSIQVPSLVISGQDDKVIPPDHALQIAQGIGPCAEVHVIENCGHLSNMEHPEKVNHLMQNWLKKYFVKEENSKKAFSDQNK